MEGPLSVISFLSSSKVSLMAFCRLSVIWRPGPWWSPAKGLPWGSLFPIAPLDFFLFFHQDIPPLTRTCFCLSCSCAFQLRRRRRKHFFSPVPDFLSLCKLNMLSGLRRAVFLFFSSHYPLRSGDLRGIEITRTDFFSLKFIRSHS